MSYQVQIAGNGLNVIENNALAPDEELTIELAAGSSNNIRGLSFSGNVIPQGEDVDDILNLITVKHPKDTSSRRVETIKATDFIPLMGEVSNSPANSHYYNDSDWKVSAKYNANKKVSEANMPYIHGELINAGTVPFDVLPTDGDTDTVLSQQRAAKQISMLGRAITLDSSGNLVLFGYYDNGSGPKLVPISKAKVQSPSLTPTQALTGLYPLS